jgi:hypothetical protein
MHECTQAGIVAHHMTPELSKRSLLSAAPLERDRCNHSPASTSTARPQAVPQERHPSPKPRCGERSPVRAPCTGGTTPQYATYTHSASAARPPGGNQRTTTKNTNKTNQHTRGRCGPPQITNMIMHQMRRMQDRGIVAQNLETLSAEPMLQGGDAGQKVDIRLSAAASPRAAAATRAIPPILCLASPQLAPGPGRLRLSRWKWRTASRATGPKRDGAQPRRRDQKRGRHAAGSRLRCQRCHHH